MKIFTSELELQQEALKRKMRGETIGFVPTMGYLHSGHTSLIDIARKKADWVVCSIYINPLQFGPNEDLDQYPKDLQGDMQKCSEHGVDALFNPTNLYEDNHSTYVNVLNLSTGLCGGSRPKHFQGVTTIVSKLFGIVQPNFAVFGEKDFQQLAIIRKMVHDLRMPIEIIGAPLIRDHDGLALSSRNRYLNPEERKKALSISKTLHQINTLVDQAEGVISVPTLCKRATELLQVDELDYLEIVDPFTLRPLKQVSGSARVLIAAWVGTTRLIDNLEIRR
jgi:pantoate--beta-alanine ligase